MAFNPVEYFNLNQKPMLEIRAGAPRNLGGELSRRRQDYTWMKAMFGGEYNPDKLTYRDYNNMILDPQVKSSLLFITYAMLRQRWTVTPASDDKKDKEVADFVTKAYKNMQIIPMRQVLKDTFSDMKYGYSVAETVWHVKDVSTPRVMPYKIKPLAIDTIENCFVYTPTGEVESIIQNVGDGNPITIPAEKCLISTFNEEMGNKYGSPLLKEVNNNVFMKKQILKWWAVFLQKHESPNLAGFYSAKGNQADMQKMLNGFYEGRMNAVFPEGDQVQVIESTHHGEGFLTALHYHDMIIQRNFLIGTLLFGQQEASGSYSQSQTHLDTAMIFLDGSLADHAIPWQMKTQQMVDYNFGVEEYPQFAFEPFRRRDVVAVLNAIQPYAEKFMLSKSVTQQVLEEALEEMGFDILFEGVDEEALESEPDTEPAPLPDGFQGMENEIQQVEDGFPQL
ncbi:DUF935 family protein [uncultured Methanobacterium sp.]|uniref:phage portal protein family protein n=1 Tax=uncultured Methanobacterium sp. TaxID=176306 RepID=UPI002AA7DBB3|nr:DUF935 family protein [uncultured Methanobacterium sp.]